MAGACWWSRENYYPTLSAFGRLEWEKPEFCLEGFNPAAKQKEATYFGGPTAASEANAEIRLPGSPP